MVDGDTIKVEIDGVVYTVRYIGIDTPETVHPSLPVEPLGKEAAAKNAELVADKMVMLEKDISETDQYGRLLRYVWVGEVLVNAELVRLGYAQVVTFPPDVRYQDLLLSLQREARAEERGLWGLPPAPTATDTLVASIEPTILPAATLVTATSGRIRVAPDCSKFDAAGNDHQNLNDEYVCLRNEDSVPINLHRWKIRDIANHVYIFPQFVLLPGTTVTLHTGRGENTSHDLYWGRTQAVWNNDGDTVWLYDSAGNLIHEYSY